MRFVNVCRIESNTKMEVVYPYGTPKGSIVYFDAIVQLGSQEGSRTEKPIRLVKYSVEGTDCPVAANRFDLGRRRLLPSTNFAGT